MYASQEYFAFHLSNYFHYAYFLAGHRRVASGGRSNELLSSMFNTPHKRIEKKIEALENDLDKKYRESKQIGQIYYNTSATHGSVPDPVTSLKTRNIDFQWRRGTRIGQGGAGIAFRAINCSNGSIVCMKEIQLSSIASRSLSKTYLEKLRDIAKEIDMIMSIDDPNIVRYFGIERYKVKNNGIAIRNKKCSFSFYLLTVLFLENNLYLYGILYSNSQ